MEWNQYGTCPCPQEVGGDELGNKTLCNEPSSVEEGELDSSGQRTFRSVCPNNHTHYFGEYYLENNVEENPS